MPNRLQGPNREDPAYRPYVPPKKQKKKETYTQLEIPLAKGKAKFKHDPRTSANA